jgi:hypothetical protein
MPPSIEGLEAHSARRPAPSAQIKLANLPPSIESLEAHSARRRTPSAEIKLEKMPSGAALFMKASGASLQEVAVRPVTPSRNNSRMSGGIWERMNDAEERGSRRVEDEPGELAGITTSKRQSGASARDSLGSRLSVRLSAGVSRLSSGASRLSLSDRSSSVGRPVEHPETTGPSRDLILLLIFLSSPLLSPHLLFPRVHRPWLHRRPRE